jgi:hypothetical protein
MEKTVSISPQPGGMPILNISQGLNDAKALPDSFFFSGALLWEKLTETRLTCLFLILRIPT